MEPKPDESLRGFLVRVAERNHLNSMAPLVRFVKNREDWLFDDMNLLQLAELARCDVADLAAINLYAYRDHNGYEGYKRGSHRISKGYFVVHRYPRVCPICLRESEYLRAIWDITFVVACPQHGSLLIDICPHCKKFISWERPGVFKCKCGFDLRRSQTDVADDDELTWSWMIAAAFGEPLNQKLSSRLPILLIRRLLNLSPDAILKTIWYFGNYVAAEGNVRAGHARHHPNTILASKILRDATNSLLDWPKQYVHLLEHLGSSPIRQFNMSKLERMFGSVHRYLLEEMSDPELRFVHAAYEWAVREIWRKTQPHKSRTPEIVSRQMEFNF